MRVTIILYRSSFFVVSGAGDIMIENELGTPVKTAIAAGSTVTIPRGAFHSTVNTCWEPLRILAVYAPAGPNEVMNTSDEFTIFATVAVPARD